MTITSRLFEAYLKCPTKCFLWSRGETGTSNSYADWAQVLNISYRSEGISRLKDGVASNECVAGPSEGKDLKAAKWRLAVNSKAYAENLESAIDAVERVPGDTPGGIRRGISSHLQQFAPAHSDASTSSRSCATTTCVWR